MAWTSTSIGSTGRTGFDGVAAQQADALRTAQGTATTTAGGGAAADTSFDRVPVSADNTATLANAVTSASASSIQFDTSVIGRDQQDDIASALLTQASTVGTGAPVSDTALDTRSINSADAVRELQALSGRQVINDGQQTLADGLNDVRALTTASNVGPDGVNAGVKGLAQRLTDNVKRYDIWLDGKWNQIEFLKRLLSQETNEDKQAKILEMINEMMGEWTMVRKEREKQEELRRLLFMLLLGVYIPPELIQKLRAMGLGNVVDEMVRTMLHKGKVTPQLVECLKAAGFGAVIQSDEKKLNAELQDEKDKPKLLEAAREQAAGPKPGKGSPSTAGSRVAASAGAGIDGVIEKTMAMNLHWRPI